MHEVKGIQSFHRDYLDDCFLAFQPVDPERVEYISQKAPGLVRNALDLIARTGVEVPAMEAAQTVLATPWVPYAYAEDLQPEPMGQIRYEAAIFHGCPGDKLATLGCVSIRLAVRSIYAPEQQRVVAILNEQGVMVPQMGSTKWRPSDKVRLFDSLLDFGVREMLLPKDAAVAKERQHDLAADEQRRRRPLVTIDNRGDSL